MSETNRGRAQDRAKVAGGQKHETAYEAKKTGTSSGEVRKDVGDAKENVKETVKEAPKKAEKPARASARTRKAG